MKTADICLILEGTYPFVSGGVSSWVHHLTSHLSHLTFTVLHISPKRGFYTKGHVYKMPPNVLGVKEVYLHDYVISSKGRPTNLREKVEFFRDLVRDMVEGESGSFASFLRALQAEGNEGFSSFDLLQTPESWDVLSRTTARRPARRASSTSSGPGGTPTCRSSTSCRPTSPRRASTTRSAPATRACSPPARR